MRFQILASQIFKFDSKVKQVALCDLNGKIVFNTHTEKVHKYFSEKQSQKALSAAAKAWKERKAASRNLGKLKYTISEYENFKRISVPVGRKYIIFVSTTPDTNHIKLIERIQHFKALQSKLVSPTLIAKNQSIVKTLEYVEPITIAEMAKIAIPESGKFKINKKYEEKFVQALVGKKK